MRAHAVPPTLPAPAKCPPNEEGGLLIGWTRPETDERGALGFQGEDTTLSPRTETPLCLFGEGHLMTIAPTGAGKGVSAVIPALLTHPGSIIVVDPKGENALVTARARREMGQEVVVLDPFRVTGLGPEEGLATFNPLDILRMDGDWSWDDAEAMSARMVPIQSDKDPFWDIMAGSLLQGLLLHVATAAPRPLRTMSEVHFLANQSRKDFELTLFEMTKSKNPGVRRCGAAFSQTEAKVSASIISTLQSHLRVLGSPVLTDQMESSSTDFTRLVDGDRPMSIYLVLPPTHLVSHARLLRLWVGSLMALVMRRSHRPKDSTLFLIDEAAQLGALEELRLAMTLLRGYGLQTWSFWQDLGQIQRLYADDWQTLVHNCKVIQHFGVPFHRAATKAGELVGFPDTEKLVDLDPTLMLLTRAGRKPMIVRRPDYRTDGLFAGRHDPNPFHTSLLPEGEAKLFLPKPEEAKTLTISDPARLETNVQIAIDLIRASRNDFTSSEACEERGRVLRATVRALLQGEDDPDPFIRETLRKAGMTEKGSTSSSLEESEGGAKSGARLTSRLDRKEN